MEPLEPRLPLSGTAYEVTLLEDNRLFDGEITFTEAIEAANSDSPVGDAPAGNGADTITFHPSLAGGTLALAGNQLVISGDLTITGLGSDKLTINADDESRHFEINPGVNVVMSGLTLDDGNAGEGTTGGAIYSNGILTLDDMVFVSNRAGMHGGALLAHDTTITNSLFDSNEAIVDGGAILSITTLSTDNVTFVDNTAHSSGGAIFNVGTLDIDNSSFASNKTLGIDGGAIWSNNLVFVSDTDFDDNVAAMSGGAIFSSGKLDVQDSAFTGNQAQGWDGGAIWSSKATGLTHSDFESNQATKRGGAVFSRGPLVVDDAKFDTNLAVELDGGAIWSNNRLVVGDSEFTENRSGRDGGGIRKSASPAVDISESHFENNYAGGSGGGLSTYSPTTVDQSVFDRNESVRWGGGVHTWGDYYDVLVTSSTVSGNQAGIGGGGIFTGSRRLDIEDSTIRVNAAVSDGGGVYVWDGATTLVSSLLSDNTTSQAGGGIYVLYYGELTVINSTLSGNQAATHGGGVFLGNVTNTAPFRNVTLTANRSDSDGQNGGDGGGLFTAGSVALLHNTIVSGNFKGTGEEAWDIAGDIDPESSHNLVGNAATSGGLTDGVNRNLVGMDPRLGPLGDNGGRSLTHALTAGSPAIDAGDNAQALFPNLTPLVFDQRGPDFDRIVDLHVDIGAYEAIGPGGRITGRKWLDVDNGQGDAVPAVIYLDLNRNGTLDDGEPVAPLRDDDPSTADVDETGTYRFSGLPAGFYHVREFVPPGYEQIFPASPGTHGVTIAAQETRGEINFGNRISGEIHGVKFLDINGNGRRDRNPLLGDAPDVLMVIDVSSSTNTGSGLSVGDVNGDGRSKRVLDVELYAMLKLRRELIDLGWGDSARVGVIVYNASALTLDMDPVTPGVQLTTTALADANGDGVSDLEHVLRSVSLMQASGGPDTDFEEALSTAISVFADLDSQPEQANLFFCSDGLANNRWSYVDEVEQLAAMGVQRVAMGFGPLLDIEPLQAIDPDAFTFDSRMKIATALAARSRYDGDPGEYFIEPGMSGVTIYLDSNGNGQLDGGEPSTVTAVDDPATPDIDEEGTYSFQHLTLDQYVVREVVPAGYVRTWPPPPGSHHVDIAVDSLIAEDVDFGNTLAPGSIPGLKCSDLNGNGVHDPGEPFLANVTVYLDLNNNGQLDLGEPSTVTVKDDAKTADIDETGTFRFTDVPPGEYVVRELVPDGYVQSSPDLGYHTVRVDPGQTVTDLLFLNFPQFAIVGGFKWIDTDGNGTRDLGEPGLAGVRIYLDLNKNGKWDSGEPSTWTKEDDPSTPGIDETGTWELTGVIPGTYQVREVPAEGYSQSYPVGGKPHVVTVGPLETISDLLFGNMLLPPGTLGGTKFLDLNGNGQRDPNRLCGQDLIYVVDVSDSTRLPFEGVPVGDVNGDGSANTVLDGELASIIAVNRSLIARGLDQNIRVAIVAFGDQGFQIDVDPSTSGGQLTTHPASDLDGDGVPDIEQVLKSLRREDFGSAIRTDYSEALQTVEQTLSDAGTALGNASVLFVSDGHPNNENNYDDEVARLNARGTSLSAFGAGSNAKMHTLKKIDPSAVAFSSPAGLVAAFTLTGIPGAGTSACELENRWAEPNLAGVIIYLDDNDNGQLDWTDADGNDAWDPGEGERWTVTREDDPSTPDIDETGQWEFTGLEPGQYIIREILPPYYRQTVPANNAPIVVTLDPGKSRSGLLFGNQPPVVLLNATATIAEDADTTVRIKVADIIVTHDALRNFPPSIDGTDAGMFEADAGILYLKAGSSLDFETNPVLDVTVAVDDPSTGTGPEGSADLAIQVRDVNEPPTDITLDPGTVAENIDTSSGDVPVGTLVATDEDTNNTYVFTLVPGGGDMDNSLFAIVGDTLDVKQGTILDYETKDKYFVRVLVHDGLNTLEKAIEIGVIDENEPPEVWLTQVITTLAENAEIDTRLKVADIEVTDDALGSAYLALAGQDAAMFEIESNVLYLQAGATLDYETNGVLDVTVEVDDPSIGATPDDAAPLTIQLTDENEPPQVSLVNEATSLAERPPLSTRLRVADVDVIDDSLGVNELALSGEDVSMFEIDSGTLYLKAGATIDFETNRELKVTVTVDDTEVGTTPDDTADLIIEVSDRNDPPTIDLVDTISTLPEDADLYTGIRVASVEITDDALGMNELMLTGADAALFEIRAHELFLRDTAALDHESNGILNVTVAVDDHSIGSTPEDAADLSILISDVGEPPTAIGLTPATIAEDASTEAGDVLVGTFLVTDDDVDDTHVFDLVPGEGDLDNSRFLIVGDELFVRQGTILDYENRSTYFLRVRGNDGTFDLEKALTVHITDVNETPTVALVNTLTTLSEDLDTGTRLKVADIVISDDAMGSNSTVLDGADAAIFVIEAGGLYLTADASLDHETLAQLEVVVAVDDASLGATPDDQALLTIDVTDVNETPTSISLDDDTVDENTIGAVVGNLVVSDPDMGDTHQLSVSDSRFEIVGGQLRLAADTSLDHEATSTISVQVTAVDSGDLAHTETLLVHVVDVNEAPTALVLEGTEVQENTVGSLIGTLTVSDPDNGDAHTFSVADARMEVVDGKLKLRTGQTLDHEAEPTLSVEITAEDSGGLTIAEMFVITVTDINEAPSGIVMPNQKSVDEYAMGAGIGNLSVIDPDAGDTHALNVSDARFEIVSGKLRLRADEHLVYEQEQTVALDVTAEDAAGLACQESFLIVVNNVNEAPTAIHVSNTAFDENAAGVTIGNVSVSDPDSGDTHTLVVSDARFEIVTGQLRLTAGANLDHETEPTISLDITATDAGQMSLTETFEITVNDVNEQPTDIALDNASVDENLVGAVIGNLTIADPDDGDSHTLSVSDLRFAIVANQLVLKPNTSLDHESGDELSLQITAEDSGDETRTEDFVITVNDVNEGPTDIDLDNVSIQESAAGGVIGNLTVNDPDVGEVHHWTVSDPRFEVQLGQLKLKADTGLDYEAEDAILLDITVTDSGQSSRTESYVIAVLDVNEAPSDIVTGLLTVRENAAGAAIGVVTATDPEGDSVVLSISDSRFDLSAGRLRLDPAHSLDYETESTVPVNITATDPAGLTRTEPFVIVVTDLNEAPTDIALDNLSVVEHATGAIVGNVAATDPDDGDSNVLNVSDERFEIVAGQLKLKADRDLDYELESTVSVDITAVDSGGLDRTETFVLAVIDMNEYPWLNPAHPCDINDDALITALDILTLRNDINSRGSRQLNAAVGQPAAPPYLDPSADNIVSAVDVLQVISYINAHGSGPIPAGEGEAPVESPAARYVVPFDSVPVRLQVTDEQSRAVAGLDHPPSTAFVGPLRGRTLRLADRQRRLATQRVFSAFRDGPFERADIEDTILEIATDAAEDWARRL